MFSSTLGKALTFGVARTPPPNSFLHSVVVFLWYGTEAAVLMRHGEQRNRNAFVDDVDSRDGNFICLRPA